MALPVQAITDFAGQNWLIVPAALAVNEPPPADIHGQKWLLTLSGVALVGLQGASNGDWLRETLLLLPTILDPIHFAIATHGIPTPPGTEGVNYRIGFQLEQGAPFASISSIFDANQSVNAGFAVDVWRPNHFDTGFDFFTHASVGTLYTGLQVDVAVRDTDAFLYRVGYNIALLGKIVFLTLPQILFLSNFQPTAVGQPPSQTQAVGTAAVVGPTGTVDVINSPTGSGPKWLRIGRPAGAQFTAEFQCILIEAVGPGVYNMTATLFLTDRSDIATIFFESPQLQFTHIDFLPRSNQVVRLDDNDATDFGSFPLNQPFKVDVTLTIALNTHGTLRVVLSGSGASGDVTYTIPAPPQLMIPFTSVRVMQGFPNSGPFDVTNIEVSRPF